MRIEVLQPLDVARQIHVELTGGLVLLVGLVEDHDVLIIALLGLHHADDELASLGRGLDEVILGQNLHAVGGAGVVGVGHVHVHEDIRQTSDLPVQLAPEGEQLGVTDGTVAVDEGVVEALTLGVGATGADQVEPGQSLEAVGQVAVDVPAHLVLGGHTGAVPGGGLGEGVGLELAVLVGHLAKHLHVGEDVGHDRAARAEGVVVVGQVLDVLGAHGLHEVIHVLVVGTAQGPVGSVAGEQVDQGVAGLILLAVDVHQAADLGEAVGGRLVHHVVADAMLLAACILHAGGDVSLGHTAVHDVDHVALGVLGLHVLPVGGVKHGARAEVLGEDVEVHACGGHLIQLVLVAVYVEGIEGHPGADEQVVGGDVVGHDLSAVGGLLGLVLSVHGLLSGLLGGGGHGQSHSQETGEEQDDRQNTVQVSRFHSGSPFVGGRMVSVVPL